MSACLLMSEARENQLAPEIAAAGAIKANGLRYPLFFYKWE